MKAPASRRARFIYDPRDSSKIDRAVRGHAIARAAGKTLVEARQLIDAGCLGWKIVKSQQYSRDIRFAAFYDDDVQPSSTYNKFAQDHQDFLQQDKTWTELFARHCGTHMQTVRMFWMVSETHLSPTHPHSHQTQDKLGPQPCNDEDDDDSSCTTKIALSVKPIVRRPPALPVPDFSSQPNNGCYCAHFGGLQDSPCPPMPPAIPFFSDAEVMSSLNTVDNMFEFPVVGAKRKLGYE